jgi:hypothetical protein
VNAQPQSVTYKSPDARMIVSILVIITGVAL